MSDYFIGLTGGIASGKSALERAFAARGIAVADADLLAREVVRPGEPALAAVAERFGRDVLMADGQLDRAALRVRVFGNEEERRALEAIVHPAIRRRLEEICRQATSPYAIATIPLLTEGGGRAAYPWLHRILVVDTPTEVQKQRLMQRDGIDAVLADKMMAAQASRADRLALADDIVVNDGDITHLQRAADDLHRRYLALADAGNMHSMANNRPL
ncbi:dephospho-CoA kinase [Pseudoxanthomonas sp. SE1]|uniref:dephospho-CoA kinase n=1 Tax=Pseudoxanthomonas sp. SE1 TaxID=1664560 RepID=UPI00240E6EC0|nr:dephospho-CoA kinase [Pseudoxanthomonas sp. SE1]WFC41238.1 dephospho-CoA kinase [Pseudoxanthomonas sp. SE1]